MKRAAACVIVGLYGAGVCTVIGAQVRGDARGEEMARDAITGAAVLGAALAVRWAFAQLGSEE